MTELYEKSLRKLELDDVLAQLADCAQRPRKVRTAAAPCCRWTMRRRSACSSSRRRAACGMIVRKGAPGFHELKPVAASRSSALTAAAA